MVSHLSHLAASMIMKLILLIKWSVKNKRQASCYSLFFVSEPLLSYDPDIIFCQTSVPLSTVLSLLSLRSLLECSWQLLCVVVTPAESTATLGALFLQVCNRGKETEGLGWQVNVRKWDYISVEVLVCSWWCTHAYLSTWNVDYMLDYGLALVPLMMMMAHLKVLKI